MSYFTNVPEQLGQVRDLNYLNQAESGFNIPPQNSTLLKLLGVVSDLTAADEGNIFAGSGFFHFGYGNNATRKADLYLYNSIIMKGNKKNLAKIEFVETIEPSGQEGFLLTTDYDLTKKRGGKIAISKLVFTIPMSMISNDDAAGAYRLIKQAEMAKKEEQKHKLFVVCDQEAQDLHDFLQHVANTRAIGR